MTEGKRAKSVTRLWPRWKVLEPKILEYQLPWELNAQRTGFPKYSVEKEPTSLVLV